MFQMLVFPLPETLPVPLGLPFLGVCVFPLPSVRVYHKSCKSHLCTTNFCFDVFGFHICHFAPVNTALMSIGCGDC